MERRRRIRCAVHYLALLVEVLVRGENVGAEDTERIPVKLIASRLCYKADHTSSAALVGSRGILRFHARLFDAVLGNVEGGNDGCDIIFRDAQRTAINHVIDGSNDGAVDGVRGNIDPRAAAGDVLNGKGAGGVWCPVCGSNAGAELYEVEDVAREKGDAVDGFRGDQLAYG